MSAKTVTEWPKIRVQYHGNRADEIITLEQAIKRFKLDEKTVDSLRNRWIVGTTVNKSPNSEYVYMIHHYGPDDSIRDAATDLLTALEGIMDHDLVPRNSVCGKMALAAIAKAKREGK